MKPVVWMLCLLLISPLLRAETLNLEQAIERALKNDARIDEKRYLVDAARALLQEANGSSDIMIEATTILGLAPTYDDGIFTNGSDTCPAGEACTVRDGSLDFDGVTPWVNLQVAIIKPLYTWGKIENYATAAQGNIEFHQGEVRLQQVQTRLDVTRAYNGYLTARDTRLLLTDTKKRIANAEALLQKRIDSETGDAKQSDLFALQTGAALIRRYLAQADGMEKIALAGLKMLTGIGLDNDLEVADRRLRPVALPEGDLAILTQKALDQRPEMAQVEAGLRARRALVEAKKAEAKPNLFTGVVGGLSHAFDRHRVDSPYIFDPFSYAALTPVLGLQWNWATGVQAARVSGAEAELNALIAKASFARQGIPFQVAEQYHQVHAYREMVRQMEQASRAGRRWMISAYADFEAGLEETSEVVEAFKSYVLAHSEYLLSVNEYNMHVAKLNQVIGTF